MVVGVIADEMTVFLHLFYNIFFSLDIFSHKKKCGMDPSLPKAVQKHGGIGYVRPVIKGECGPGTVLRFTPVRYRLGHGFCCFLSVLCFHQPEHSLTGDHSGHLHPKRTV